MSFGTNQSFSEGLGINPFNSTSHLSSCYFPYFVLLHSYSDPDRANLYLGGGAIPQNSQSIAYLLRNDVLTNVEDMRAEVAYLLKVLRKGEGELELEDILAMSKMGKEGMAKYLDLVPPKELEAARSKFAAA